MLIYDAGLCRRVGKKPSSLFGVNAWLPESGPTTVMWQDEDGVKYIASINVRAEFSPDYESSHLIPDDAKELENSISESLQEKNEDEEWV